MMYLPIAIPSYKRSKIISKKTLRFLNQCKYPSDLITIFVANQEEAANYRADIPSNLYGQIIIGVLGLIEQRKFISDYYKEDEIIAQMDDDVVKIVSPYLTFKQILQKACIELTLNKSGLWGVMPNDDTRKFSDINTMHLTHILGSFFICRNHRNLITTTSEKEDYERSILYFKKYNCVHRYKGAGVRTNYAKTLGGLQQEGRLGRMAEEVKYLSEKYSAYCKPIIKKEMPDLSLNWRATNPSSSPS